MYPNMTSSPGRVADRWFDGIAGRRPPPYWVIEVDGEHRGASANLADIYCRNAAAPGAYYLASPPCRSWGWLVLELVWIANTVFGPWPTGCGFDVLLSNGASGSCTNSTASSAKALFRHHLINGRAPSYGSGWPVLHHTVAGQSRGDGPALLARATPFPSPSIPEFTEQSSRTTG